MPHASHKNCKKEKLQKLEKIQKNALCRVTKQNPSFSSLQIKDAFGRGTHGIRVLLDVIQIHESNGIDDFSIRVTNFVLLRATPHFPKPFRDTWKIGSRA